MRKATAAALDALALSVTDGEGRETREERGSARVVTVKKEVHDRESDASTSTSSGVSTSLRSGQEERGELGLDGVFSFFLPYIRSLQLTFI